MIDLLKAQIQKAKQQLSETFTTGISEVNDKVNVLETFKTNQENANKPGSTASFSGKVQIEETLKVQGEIDGTTGKFSGAVTSQNEKLATENFVLANSSGGSGSGAVEMTKTYRFESTANQTEFIFDFTGTAVAVFSNGLKLDTTDYAITSKSPQEETKTISGTDITLDKNIHSVQSITIDGTIYNLDDVTFTDNVITLKDDSQDGDDVTVKYENKSRIDLNEGADEGTIIHGIAYGGADVYTKTQVNAAFIPRQDIIDDFISKAEMQQMAADVEPVLLSSVADIQGDWANYDDQGTTGWNVVIHKTWDGFVHISGIVTGDTNGTTIFSNLAPRFRPTKNIMSNQIAFDKYHQRLNIYPDGNIELHTEGTRPDDETNWVSINVIYYAGN